MAVLSKNGHEIGRVTQLTRVLSFRSNGKVLYNYGTGWKVFRDKVADINVAFETAKAAEEALHPDVKAYKKLFHSHVPQKSRGLAQASVRTLSDDLDGLWSEFNDYLHIGISVEEVQELIDAHAAAVKALREGKKA